MTSWPNGVPGPTRILDHGHHDPEGGCGQDDRHQQRRFGQPGGVETEGGHHGERQRHAEGRGHRAQAALPGRMEGDLEAGKEEEEHESDREKTSSGASIWTILSTCGPIRIPATISTTIGGIAGSGRRSSRSGETVAAAIAISKLP
jgi:hypothetical protein